MEISSKHQMFVFVLSIISGLGCGLLFDVQRSLRKLRNAGKIRTAAEDLIFVVICTVVSLALGYLFNRGQMRYYQIMGLVCGVLLYSAFLSRIAMKLLSAVYKITEKILIVPAIKIVKLIIRPLVLFYGVLCRKITKTGHILRRFGQSIKNRRQHMKKRMKML